MQLTDRRRNFLGTVYVNVAEEGAEAGGSHPLDDFTTKGPARVVTVSVRGPEGGVQQVECVYVTGVNSTVVFSNNLRTEGGYVIAFRPGATGKLEQIDHEVVVGAYVEVFLDYEPLPPGARR